MNLYKFHQSPEDLHKHKEAEDSVVDMFWDKYKNNPKELKKKEWAIAKSAEYSYLYARNILEGRFELGRFELGEPAIAKSAEYSYLYAADVLNGKFPLGEPAIAKSAKYSYYYAEDVLHGKFPLGEPEIAKKANLWKEYCEIFGIKE
jgi:hypothetical protein